MLRFRAAEKILRVQDPGEPFTTRPPNPPRIKGYRAKLKRPSLYQRFPSSSGTSPSASNASLYLFHGTLSTQDRQSSPHQCSTGILLTDLALKILPFTAIYTSPLLLLTPTKIPNSHLEFIFSNLTVGFTLYKSFSPDSTPRP